MKTKQVTAQLFQAARRITAEPGQYLMVVADMVIGVYTGDEVVPVKPAPAPSVEQPQPKRLARTKRYGGQKRTKKDGMPLNTVQPIIMLMAKMLTEHKDWMFSSHVRTDITNFRPETKYWQVRDAAAWMAQHGWIEARGKSNTRQYRRIDGMPHLTLIEDHWERAA